MLTSVENRWVTVREASRLASVSRRTIYHWLDKHRIRTARTPSGTIRIWRDDILPDAPLEARSA